MLLPFLQRASPSLPSPCSFDNYSRAHPLHLFLQNRPLLPPFTFFTHSFRPASLHQQWLPQPIENILQIIRITATLKSIWLNFSNRDQRDRQIQIPALRPKLMTSLAVQVNQSEADPKRSMIRILSSVRNVELHFRALETSIVIVEYLMKASVFTALLRDASKVLARRLI